MSTFSVSELEAAIEKWKASTGIAPPKWKDKDGFWLGSGYPRGVYFRFCSDGLVAIELKERLASKVAPLASVDHGVQLLDLFLRQGTAFDALPGSDWKTYWNYRPVPANVIDHPERITVEEIDNQSDHELRSAMIDRYGEERYRHDTKLKPTGLIHDLTNVENVIENWRASTGAKVDVVREELWSDDPRNATERIVARSGDREVVFWEPNSRKDYRVDVSVSEGDVTKAGYVSRREEAERLLEVFFGSTADLKNWPLI